MSGASDFRASDADREQAAQDIREHFAAGRLTEDEMAERIQAVYVARTDGDLRRLLADLPKLPVTRAQQKAALVERRRHLQRQLLQQSGGGVALFVVCTVIWLANGAHRGSFWPAWVLIFVVLPLIRNGWRLYGPAPELDRVEAELTRRGRGGSHRQRRRY